MSVQDTAISRAVGYLKAVGAQFKVITPDGQEFGDLVIAQPPPERKRARNKFPMGTLTQHLKPYIDAMDGLGIGTVPWGPFENDEDKERLHGAVTSYASNRWGNKSYISEKTIEGVQVLRATLF